MNHVQRVFGGLVIALLSHPACSSTDETTRETSGSTAAGTGAAGGHGGAQTTGTGGENASTGGAEGGSGGMGASAHGGGGAGGAGGACSTGQGGFGGAVDPEDPCSTMVAPRVAWVTRADPKITITNEIELLWGFQFAVALPPDELDEYSLEHERCEKPAGEPETCTSGFLDLDDTVCEVRFAPKFGVDPSQYNEGDNAYRFSMRLWKGCRIVSEDSFGTILTYHPD